MLEAADNPMPGIDIESSVNPEGHHVEQLEKLADEASVPKATNAEPLNQSTVFDASWEKDLN